MGYPSDHPDVAAALRTGYPTYALTENVDTPEARADFLRERFDDFLDWLQHGDQDVVERFLSEHDYDR